MLHCHPRKLVPLVGENAQNQRVPLIKLEKVQKQISMTGKLVIDDVQPPIMPLFGHRGDLTMCGTVQNLVINCLSLLVVAKYP